MQKQTDSKAMRTIKEKKTQKTKKERTEEERKIIQEIFESSKAKGCFTLGLEALDVLKASGIATVQSSNAKSLEKTLEAAERIGYPLVMKILSPQLSHKSEVGGIKLDLKNASEVKAAYLEMMAHIPKKRPNASLKGVQLQKMLPAGKEVIIGMVRDPTFGPLLMFGLGGVYVEILKDVSFALTPVSSAEALHMIKEIKAYPLLAGARGEKPTDLKALSDTIVSVSRLVFDFPEILEFEINPLIVFEKGKGALAVDMRLILSKNGSE